MAAAAALQAQLVALAAQRTGFRRVGARMSRLRRVQE